MQDSLTPFLIAFLASAIAAYPIFRLLLAMKSRQTVSQYAPEGHQKKQGTPTMGGLIVAVGFLAVPGWAILSANSSGQKQGLAQNQCIFGLFFFFAAIGFIDDFVVPRMFVGKRGLGWKQKILMQLGSALLWIHFMYGDFSLECLVTVFMVLFFSNAYNFSDGLDGLASLLLIGFVGGLLGIAYYDGQWGLSVYLFALLGAILPFFYLNRPKAKLFMGDVGSLPIGAVLGLAVGAIAYTRGGPGLNFFSAAGHQFPHHRLDSYTAWLIRDISLFAASGMMMVELVPVPLQILSVKLRKKKLFSFTPIHHAFERKGWAEIKVVGVFAACQIILSLIAVAIARYGDMQPAREVRWHYEFSAILRPSADSSAILFFFSLKDAKTQTRPGNSKREDFTVSLLPGTFEIEFRNDLCVFARYLPSVERRICGMRGRKH